MSPYHLVTFLPETLGLLIQTRILLNKFHKDFQIDHRDRALNHTYGMAAYGYPVKSIFLR